LLDAAPDAIVIVAESGEVAYANDHAFELFGCGPDDLLERPVEELLPESRRAVHRTHRTRYRAEPTVRAMGAGLVLWARRHDGTEFPVEISLSPLHIGTATFTVAAVRDIRDRLRTEEHLHRVIHMLDASDDGVFIFDADSLRFAFVNAGAERLMGYTRDELLTMTPLDLNPAATEDEYRDLVDSLAGDQGGSIVRQVTWLRKDGVEVPIEKTLRSGPPSHDDGRWVIALARDVSARLAADAELQASRDALRAAEQEVAVSNDRERIARNLHDTVIQRLFGEGLNLQAAMSSVDDPERTRERLATTIDGLDETIKELRSAIFSLQGAGRVPGGLRGRLATVTAEATTGLGFEPRLQFDGPIESIDEATAEQMLPVLREALSNVAQHAGASHVRVVIEVADAVTLRVVDDGVGAPEQVVGGRGTANMAERAHGLGGTFAIEAGEAGGTVMRWTVPFLSPERPP
jgi:PAS domain S-box-containing protein